MRSLLLSVLLMFSIVLAACGGQQAPVTDDSADTDAESEDTPDAVAIDEPLPDVFNADAASEYSGAQLTFYGDGVGLGSSMDEATAAHFTEATGIEIEVIPRPQDATETFATYQRFFQAQSSDIDVMMVDVIWPGSLAPHLVDLSDVLGEEAQNHYPTIVENNTIDGSLVAMPWFGDFGMLYYRTDLLEKYGYDGPPATWDELEEIAQTVQDGERDEGNDAFVGFVWQGSAYEGLTCNMLEWIYTHNGGTMITDGEITISNPDATAAMERAAGWVGTISPEGVVSYQEEDARNVFQGGNAMFMRNWPYAYAAGQADESQIQGLFDVAPLPTSGEGETAGTVGGWQLAVSAYSENPEAAIEFIRYVTSPEMQIWRAKVGTYVPTIPEVSQDEEVLEVMPFLDTFTDVTRVTRPSDETGNLYNEASAAIFQGGNEVLLGTPADEVMTRIEEDLQFLLDQ